jgi:hypothetical protein
MFNNYIRFWSLKNHNKVVKTRTVWWMHKTTVHLTNEWTSELINQHVKSNKKP